LPDSLTLLIQPRDPLIARDARPFTALDPGGRARSLDWPFPQTLAGAVRTHIGTALGWTWTKAEQEEARTIGVHGPILAARRRPDDTWAPYFAAPRDAVPYANEGESTVRCLRLRPQTKHDEDGVGTDLPTGVHPLQITEDVKPVGEMAYWSLADQVRWACNPADERPPEDHLPALPRETRVHVAIDPERRASLEGKLFSTEGLAFADEPLPVPSDRIPLRRREAEPARAMLCRVTGAAAGWTPAWSLMTLGGERRAAAIEPVSVWPAAPPELFASCERAQRLRLQLVTPAHFGQGGWRPDWLGASSLIGSPPGCAGLALRLVSAAVGRPLAVSGWDFARGGPKGVRHLAPAASVYYFEVVSGAVSRELVAELWLGSVCSDQQDRRDGYGLVMPGIW
jgi:CRISPR-associated protein Cmr3